MLIQEVYNRHPKTIREQATVAQAIQEFLKDEVNGLIVLNEEGHVKGVLSLQDIAAATIPAQFKNNIAMAAALYHPGFFHEMCQSIKDWSIKKIMRKDFIKVDLETNIMAVAADFLKNDLYIVPVLENNKLIGVITRTEIKKALAIHMDIISSNKKEE